jgi:hypothetical protein
MLGWQLLLSMGLAVQPLQGQGLPPLQPGEDYRLVRSRLLSRGWRPQVNREGEGCSVLPGDRRCSLFPELASCAHTGAGYCRFEWLAPDGRGYALITREGDPNGMPGRIERWFLLH